ncbi:MAG: response regulator [Ectothiorhodospiraceae bacterium]|nr:response regulator [Ectothiorhodospiraceae bacterium]
MAQLALEVVGGYRVHLCSSELQALGQAAGFRPQLLLDVMMPGMDGPETLLELRKQSALQDVPAIFMTSKAQCEEVERYRALGAAGVIRKPFDPMSLAQEVRCIWETTCGRHAGG